MGEHNITCPCGTKMNLIFEPEDEIMAVRQCPNCGRIDYEWK